MMLRFSSVNSHYTRNGVVWLAVFLLVGICSAEHAFAGAIDPRAIQAMRKRKMMEAQQAYLQRHPEARPQQQERQKKLPATPKAPETPLPPAQDIKETIDRVMSSPKEWLKIKDERIKNLIIEYMLDRFRDEGTTFEKQSVPQCRQKMDLMIKTYPNLLSEKSMPEILKSVANLDMDYIQAMYDTKHGSRQEPTETAETGAANSKN